MKKIFTLFLVFLAYHFAQGAGQQLSSLDAELLVLCRHKNSHTQEQITAIKKLIDAGGNVSVVGQDSVYKTPLHAVAWHGHLAACVLLLENNAHVNPVNSFHSPL